MSRLGRLISWVKREPVQQDRSNLPHAALFVSTLDDDLNMDISIRDYSKESIKQTASLLVYLNTGMRDDLFKIIATECKNRGREDAFKFLIAEYNRMSRERQEMVDAQNEEPVISPIDVFK